MWCREYINKREPVKLVEHIMNKGFSSAVNTGVKNSDADIVVLLNTDVVPRANFLDSPSEKLSEDKLIFGIGCMDESIENGKKVLRGIGKARWEKGMLLHGEGEINTEKTFWVSGGSSFIRRDLYLKFGGMDEIYNPFYWEDIDLSYIAQKAGFKVVFDKNSVVEHLHDEGAIKSNYKKNRITTIAYRNQFIFIWKNISDSNLLMNHLLLLPINIFNALRRGDGEFIKGFLAALVKLPTIYNRRNFQKRFYKVTDSEILNSFK